MSVSHQLNWTDRDRKVVSVSVQEELLKDLPGWGHRSRGLFHARIVSFVVFVLMVADIMSVMVTDPSQRVTHSIHAAVVILIAVLLLCATAYLASSYRMLGREYIAKVTSVRESAVSFLTIFRPSQEDVVKVFQLTAQEVRTACEEEDLLLRTGVEACAISLTMSQGGDLDVKREELSKTFDFERFRRAANVKAAKDNFVRRRDLARLQGYVVHDSWISYSGYPNTLYPTAEPYVFRGGTHTKK